LEDIREAFYTWRKEGAAVTAGGDSLFLIYPSKEDEEALTEWKREVEKTLGISLSAGCTRIRGVMQLRDGLNNSRSACERRFFAGLGRVFVYAGDKSESIRRAVADLPDWSSLRERHLHPDKAKSILAEMEVRWRKGGNSSHQVKNEACSFLSTLFQFRADTGLLPELLDFLRRSETLGELKVRLEQQIEELGKPGSAYLLNNGQGGQLIAKAQKYIDERFTEELTLQSMADFIHVSKSYFSILFKKKTGQTFIDYLINLRIREAKRLLCQTEDKIYEVAEGAGFKDVKYFSKLFKKLTGLKPVEYRNKNRNAV
jgi:two-component system response regulator YesN